MISLKSSVKKDNFFESVLIDVIDFETKEVLFSKINITKTARLLGISNGVVDKHLKRKNIKGYYENRKTKKRYIFKLRKDDNQT